MKKMDFVKIMVVGALVLGLGIPIIQGKIRPLIVLSSSMEPVMSPGDLVILKESSPQSIERGDIMGFEDPSGRINVLISHRVIRIMENQGNRQFKTKGDAVEEPDQFIVKSKDVFGKAVFLIPYLGYLIHRAKNVLTFFLLIVIPAFLITINEFRNIVEYSDPRKARMADKADRKKGKSFVREETDYKYTRILAIFLPLLLVFGFLSLPYLQESGYNLENESLESGTLGGTAVYKVHENSLPEYVYLPMGENQSNESNNFSMLSAAPRILPAFWIGIMAGQHPLLPGLVTTFLPPMIITLLLYPVWKRTKSRGNPENRR